MGPTQTQGATMKRTRCLPAKGKFKFVMNRRTKILHRLPTTERCNVDQAMDKTYAVSRKDPAVRKAVPCLRCFGES